MSSCQEIAKRLFLGLLNLYQSGLKDGYDAFHKRYARYFFVFLNILMMPILWDTIAIVHAEVDARSLMKIYKVAIFPLDLQGMSVDHASFISSAIKHALLSEDSFEVIDYASDEEIQKGKQVIDLHHKKIWSKKSFASARHQPDTVYISQIGKKLKINTILMYSIFSDTDVTSHIYVYLVDIWGKKQYYTKVSIENLDSFTLKTQSGFDEIIKLTRRVFSDYKRDYLPHIQVVERQRREQVQQRFVLKRDHPHQDLLIAERQRQGQIQQQAGQEQAQTQPLATQWPLRRQEPSTDGEQRPDSAGQAPKRYALTLRVTPPDSTVEMLNPDLAYRSGMTLVPGRYDVKITRDGYQSVRRSVSIRDSDVTLDMVLAPQTYALTVQATPTDSTITLLNSDIAYQPGMQLPMGHYELQVSHAGYRSVQQTVTIQDAHVTLPITLERIIITPTDVVPPTILITSHDTTRDVHVHTSATRSTIWGRATDPSGVATVTVNGIQTLLDQEGNFGIEVALNEKVNPIVVTAWDTQRNVARTTFTIRRVMGVGPARRRTALVIGNAAYPTAPLRNPINDASDLAAKLDDLGFAVTLLQNATHRQMEHAVDSFSRELRGGGVGLFYYAGHGVQLEGQNYLIPVDAELAEDVDVKYEAVHASWVLERMESADNELNLVILDACRDNPFGRRWRLLQRGLAVIQAARGTLIAYATAPGGVALDGKGRNGVYTKHLLRYITAPDWTVEQMFKQVRIAVVRETRGKQTPWESSSLLGDFYFANQ